MGVCGGEVICLKRVQQSLLNESLDPPPLSKIPGSAPDSHLQGITKLECENNVQATTKLFNNLGLYVHPDKSILELSQVLEFLGFVLNSMTMTVTLSHTKVENITQVCKDLLTRTQPTIREVQLS